MPPLVGVAVKVTLVEGQIEPEGEAATETEAVGGVGTVTANEAVPKVPQPLLAETVMFPF